MASNQRDSLVMANEINRIRSSYSRVTFLALVWRSGTGPWENVHTTLVYGSRLTAQTVFSPQTAIGAVTGATYEAHRLVVDASVADAFLAAASVGEAELPGIGTVIHYETTYAIDAFLPRTQQNEKTESSPGMRSCWRRRRAPDQRRLGTLAFDEEHLVRIARDLPTFGDSDFDMLNLHRDLDRIGTLDELFPIPVELQLRSDPGGLRYEIRDPERWLGLVPGGELIFDAFDYGERVATQHVSLNAATGLISLATPQAIEASLLANSMLLDGCGGTFVRHIGINVGMMEPDAVVQAGAASVRIPVAPRTRQETRTGQPGPTRDAFVARLLAERWRKELAKQDVFSERIFEGSNPATCRADGIHLLSALAKIATSDEKPIVKIVDKYALDAEALMAIAPFAAGLPDAEIWLLTKNEAPPEETPRSSNKTRRGLAALIGALTDVIARLLLFANTPASTSDDEARFRATAEHIARQFRIKIKWFEPTIPLHDRFLQLGERVWHVGHSFNRFGCDLSAIVEFRDLIEADKLKRLLDGQFTEPPKETFG